MNKNRVNKNKQSKEEIKNGKAGKDLQSHKSRGNFLILFI
jgi:hypothetical protein